MRRRPASWLVGVGAAAIRDGFAAYRDRFCAVTDLARSRFESQDWRNMQKDSADRLNLYRKEVDRTYDRVRQLLVDHLEDKVVWAGMRAAYSSLIADRQDWELAETFFNSASRRVFSTVGLDPEIEYVRTDFDTPPNEAEGPVYRTYRNLDSVEIGIREILADYDFDLPWENIERDARLIQRDVDRHLAAVGTLRSVERVEMVESVFYRGTRAFLVGRLYSGLNVYPLVIALTSSVEGIRADAVLTDENSVSILFSFTRASFLVTCDRPYDLVRFLASLMPRKPHAELYIAIGQHKHGKTGLYRALMEYMASSDSRFEVAPGVRGLVMVVFTMPGYDLVFKVIRDSMSPPKNVSRRQVMKRYRLVFERDRIGRLLDAQEFEYLKLPRARFSEELLEELQSVAGNTVRADDDSVIVRHAYVERRVIPLNLYVKEAAPWAARKAVIEYGNAIKDMARSNIFPGDLLLKNFGVTRHGRVAFYDYDEVAFLTDCNFRVIPPPRSPEDEMASEPWFSVGAHDVFPEEFPRFLGLTGELLSALEEHHGDLFEASFWQNVQEQIRNGEFVDICPYAPEKRLRE